MTETEKPVSRDQNVSLSSSLFQRREIGAILAVAVLVSIGVFVNSEVFLSSDNILGILRNTAVVGIIGYGMTLLMVSGEFDLSVGSAMAVAAALTAVLLMQGYPFVFTVVIVLALAALYGMFQGLLITKLGLPSLIVTIGTLTLLRGLLLVVLGGVTFSLGAETYPDLLFYLGGVFTVKEASFLPMNSFPMQIFWTILLLGVMYYILNKTPFGSRSRFTGGAKESAERTGIDTDTVKILNFMLVAVLAAFAGIGQLGFTRAVAPSTGQGIELIVIASVVIGGTNLFGGEGSIPGTFLGALVFAFTQNILVLAGMGVRLFQIFTGIFIIGAVLVEVLSRELRYELFLEQYVTPLVDVLSDPASFFQRVKTDIQGVDQPLVFQTVNTLVLSSVTLLGMVVITQLVGWEFSLLFVKAGLGALGAIPALSLLLMAAVILLTAGALHTATLALGSTEEFETTLQGVMYSLTPMVLLFVPLLLAGTNFLTLVVLATVAALAIPSVYLLYVSTQTLHDFDSRNTLVSVAATLLFWVLALVYVSSQISAAA